MYPFGDHFLSSCHTMMFVLGHRPRVIGDFGIQRFLGSAAQHLSKVSTELNPPLSHRTPKETPMNKAHLLRLLRELLTSIFCILESPKAFSMACRALNAFARDPAVICSWFLKDPKRCIATKTHVFLQAPVLDRLVRRTPVFALSGEMRN